MKHVGTLVTGIEPSKVFSIPDKPADPNPITRLDQFVFDGLNGEEERLLRSIVKHALEWVEKRLEVPGVSFAIAGAVGAGKTTIALNLMKSAIVDYIVMDRDGVTLERFQSVCGTFITATELMGIMDPGRPGEGRASLFEILRDIRVVVIDDVGTEEVTFKSAADAKIVRQNRYGEFFDFCYTHKISVVVTSMIPIVTIQEKFINGEVHTSKRVNSEFITVLGNKAFDRLWQMASGYIFTIPESFPSYRRQL